MKLLLSILLWTLIPYAHAASAPRLPYTPSTLLLQKSLSTTGDLVYAFLPLDSSNAHQLVALNISSNVNVANLSLESVTTSLPFTSDDSTAFIPTISYDGEISVYAGSCSTASSSALWRFTPVNTSISANGTWAQGSTTTASDLTASDLPGADFLSTAFSYSNLADVGAAKTSIFMFGGMCPNSAATTSNWQEAASYSNHMLVLSPSTASDSNAAYTLDLASSKGPPIPEAGFTITGLSPSYTNASGVVTQTQSFLLLGGHTQTAFINMSQVGIWSLPEGSWTFPNVNSPSSQGNTELAVKSIVDRAVTSIDSRSGHSAVLTEDGTSIIVYGGWVGDITTAADPQLAVLNLGTGYGGSGDWIWSVPANQPSGAGLYGHGAVMLPGNVMLILGGHNISTPSSKRARSTSGVTALLFNATSMSWTSNYTNPSYVAAAASAAEAPNSRSSAKETAQKVGLGAGLGLGFTAVIAAFGVYFWYSKRLKQKRIDEREKHISDLSLGAANLYASGQNPEWGMRGPRSFPWSNGGWNTNYEDDHVYNSMSSMAAYENLNFGVHAFGDGSSIPQVGNKQIARKPLHSRARGAYQATPTFEAGTSHARTNSLGTAGPIHPIYEADEDLDNPQYGSSGIRAVGLDRGQSSDDINRESYRYSDPFKDPGAINRSHQVKPTTLTPEHLAQEREREISEWVTDWAAAEALLTHQAKSHSTAGRLSPTKRAQVLAAQNAGYNSEEDSGRTASNLSERSAAVSALTVSRSGSGSGGRSRSDSLRGYIMAPFSSAGGTANQNTVADKSGQRSCTAPKSAGSSGESFNTARTTFPALQAEAEILLPHPDDCGSSRDGSPTRLYAEPLGSPSKNKAHGLSRRGQGGWLGSLRRVFVGEPSHSGQTSPRSPNYSNGEKSPTYINANPGLASSEPRRTVSAGATLWRRKQGRGDWEDSAEGLSMTNTTGRSATFTDGTPPRFNLPIDRGADADADDDWDIEKAVERRVVQVMFTVPKEKLRVVNHDVAEDISDVGSLNSRQGSLKDAVIPPPPLEPESEPEPQASEPPSQSATPKGKETNRLHRPKSRVLEMVEQYEERSSPERSPERSPGR
ncbi:hypothetical protein BP5796_10738 [Coleophoma crateriformis]|uniref:Galactose oxidase-like Early set domain-containing protein n=1 Tax=Coleophoma crateriformis TaxID=565419 RepID=A0A3D8QQY6_9HELO|nr:hypothetical protein BP5796_10738 [Coleophoma crateriformis]